jgi:predicted CoA-binding protein
LSLNKIREILTKYKTVAVVGLSREPDKDSHRVSAYLKKHGFRIIPVNPFADEVLGEKSWIGSGDGQMHNAGTQAFFPYR